VGSKGTHLTRIRDLNQLVPLPLSQNPYKLGEPIGANDCGPVDPITGTFPADAYGVPTNASTPSNAVVPYGGPGVLSPAVYLGVAACGTNPDPFRAQFPGIGSITRIEEKASSTYHALEISGRHTVGGLQLSLSYTYSHSIDDSSSARDPLIVNTYDLARERASSNFDQRHLFTLSYVYDLPFFKNPGLANKILGGWQWSGITTVQTGTPFTPGNGIVGDNAGVGNNVSTGASQSFPDVAGDPKANIPNLPFTGFGPLFYNPSAFAPPRGLTFGDTPRNFLINPRRTNFDMALFKQLAINERVHFEFRAEAFNVFNHIEYAWLGGGFGSAASNSPFGSSNSTVTCYEQQSPGCTTEAGGNAYFRPAAAHNGRILQLGAKFIF
jgi:hypothetical protein